MAGVFKNAMSYLGMADVSEVDDEPETNSSESFDTDGSVASVPAAPAKPAASTRPGSSSFNRAQLSRITTIHPKSYDDAQAVGRAIREGVPVVLNLTDVSESIAYRIVDFSAGVVFGLRGSIERVTPRVFLLSPAQVSISIEDTHPQAASHDLFAD
ncbi:MAG: cell division protein SepF [Bifidobacteriaceae bacterium]|jgi:cell division inhibitor SepF|nr:cell division protein SepF [Bifidobacteriaceae bacterium]MCI1979043.1 cell division protein SepF [Bifidobacteriaceae bacterium]